MIKPEDIPPEMAWHRGRADEISTILNAAIEAGIVSPPCRITEKALQIAVSESVSDSGVHDAELAERTCKSVLESLIKRAKATIERERGQTE